MQNNQSVDDDDDGDYDDAEWLTNFDESIKKQMGYLHYIFILFDIMYSRHFEGGDWKMYMLLTILSQKLLFVIKESTDMAWHSSKFFWNYYRHQLYNFLYLVQKVMNLWWTEQFKNTSPSFLVSDTIFGVSRCTWSFSNMYVRS